MDANWLRLLPAGLRDRLAGRPALQAIILNSGWLLLDKVLRACVVVVLGIWMARYLGPEQFGKLNFAIAFVALVGTVAALGLDGIVVRELVLDPIRKEQVLGSAFALKLIGGVTAFAIAQSAIRAVQPNDALAQSMVCAIAFGMIFQAFDVIDFWFQSRVQSKYTVQIRSIAFAVLSIAKVFLIVGHARLLAFAWAASAEIALGAFGLVIAFMRVEGRKWFGTADWGTSLLLLKESWPLMFSGLAVMVYMRLDQVMLAAMSGQRQVGLYSAALRLSEVWYVVPMTAVASLMPALTSARAQSRELFLQRMEQLFSGLVRVAIAVAFVMSLASFYIITMLYGSQYSDAGPILAVHVWAAVFVFLGVGAGPYVLNEGLAKYSLCQTSGGAVLNILLNVWLIPRYGALGSAIATIISQALSAWVSNAFFAPTRKIFIMQSRSMLSLFGLKSTSS